MRRFSVHEGLYLYFITSTVVRWIPVFCREDYFKVLIDSLLHCCEHRGLRIHAFVIMPNHFHLICSQMKGLLSDVMRDLKKHTSKQLARKMAEDGRDTWLQAM